MFDYVAGKADWFAAGLPREWRLADTPRAGHLARQDVPTCDLAERVGDVRERVQAAGWDVCVVVNEQRVVLGLLRETALARNSQAMVEWAMDAGPSTFRVDVPLRAITDYMREHGLDRAWITTSNGKLAGLLRREDAERELEKGEQIDA